MRLLYTSLFTLLLPLVLLRLYWRGIKAPAYRKRWLERLAVYSHLHAQNVIWFHAVSVGEAEAVFPLIRNFQTRFPDHPILVTTTTPTGSSRVQTILGDSVEHVYLPYDIPLIVMRFFNRFKPKLAVIMEKEIWPNLFAECGKRNIPLFIINARLSANSARGYKKIAALVQPALNNVTAVLTQTQDDQQRFMAIGSNPEATKVVGNIKFDVSLSADLIEAGNLLKRQIFPARFVWLVASTHKGEDEIFLDLYRQVKTAIPELLLLLVPRHPERFKSVQKLAEDRKLNTVMRSGQAFCNRQTDVYIADTMGELKMLYAASDLAFVGGSMVPVGGHNILEPLAAGVPVMFGPHMINFQEISDNVLMAKAAVQVSSTVELVEVLTKIHQDAQFKQELVTRGTAFLQANQGATEAICSLLGSYLSTENR
jgi:3-deoxy-D-manno-octulosonic-acid transferase